MFGFLKRIGRALTRLRNFVMNLVFLSIALLIVVALTGGFDGVEVPEGGALVLDPQGPTLEEPLSYDPLGDLLGEESGASIHGLVRAVEEATEDERIKMIVLDLDGLHGASVAHAEWLGSALSGFRAAGKKAIAYGNFYTQPQYAIASYADAVYLHPQGELFLPGYSVFQPYFKNLFDNLKVKMHVFRVGEYKEAVEPFTRADMSGPAREVNQSLVDGLWDAYARQILANRELDAESFARYTDAFDQALADVEGDMAKAALEYGLVDDLMHPEQAQSFIAEIVGRDEEKGGYRSIGYEAYLQALGPRSPGERNVGLIVLRGIIQMGDDENAAASDNLVELIREAREDETVEALVVRIDSPGGSAFASELIRQEMELTQQAGKPVVASMAGLAASGGYWVAATADRIYAHPTTITGSIGVFALLPSFEESLSDIGVTSDGVGSSPLSGGLDPMRGISEPMQRVLQASIERIYQRFIHLVAQGRDMAPAAVDEIGRGRVWLGAQAQELGLVNELGGLEQAIAAAAELAELPEGYGLKRFATPISPRDQLIEELMQSARGGPEHPLAQALGKAWKMLEAFNDPGRAYALCEPCLGLLPDQPR